MDESITIQTVIGIVCVVSGLGLVAFSGGGDVSGWNKRDLLFPLGAAITFAFGNVARRFLFTTTAATPLDAVALNELAGLVGLASFLCYSKWGEFRSFLAVPRRVYAYFVGCGVFSALALFGLFAALERGQVTVVDPLSSPTSLFAILVTALFFRQVESITWRLITGAILVVSGVVLITGPQLLTF